MLPPTQRKTSQVIATGLVWGFATGMLGICVPLVAMTQGNLVLPLSVILGASVSTIAIWRSPNQPFKSSFSSVSGRDLEQRISNLEAICSNGEFAAEKWAKQLKSEDVHDAG